uniref:uncharacterized protein LOC101304401 n=1 Tax=Fragaria vesca subsp. vesca TaxID=101020 RepID=UPI0005C9853E|nr:PREDICTED: uncharacterized protein LOC101304401 [Fragaria vesca subsp. vesca]
MIYLVLSSLFVSSSHSEKSLGDGRVGLENAKISKGFRIPILGPSSRRRRKTVLDFWVTEGTERKKQPTWMVFSFNYYGKFRE